jgi:uncharacterized protein (TIGR02996 family)
MTTADALLAAVVASPDDDLPRLVYADWCEENGEPERAEFIRLQIARENGLATAAGVIREKVLLDTFGKQWLAPLRQPGEPLGTRRSHAEFRRGFVGAVWLPARWFVRHAGRLFELCPVTDLRVMFDDVFEFRLLAACERLDRLRALDLSDRRFGAAGVRHLCRSPHLPGLTVLRLTGCNLDDTAADVLCDSRLSLTQLDLRHNPLSEAARTRLRDRFGDAVRFD